MKTIVNVYKDFQYWQKPPPGIGDYLRGCCYLQWKSRDSAGGRRFDARFNLDLTPASSALSYPSVYFGGDRRSLAEAPEYFEAERDGEVDDVIERFLKSDREVLYLSTNRSWRGLDDEPDREALDYVATIFEFTPSFQANVNAKLGNLPQKYTLLHIRDADRSGAAALSPRSLWDAFKYEKRVRLFIEKVLPAHLSQNPAIVCMSNHMRLRNRLCRKYDYTNLRTKVENPGFKGILSEGELIDLALMKNAEALVALSYFHWSSGFSVWITRLFKRPAFFFNARSVFS